MFNLVSRLYGSFCRGLDFLQPAVALAARLYVAKVFFMSGMTKIASWSSTLALFEYEYSVPVLSPTVAAYLSTAAELGLPVLLVFGLATRIGALGLLILNVVAVISYPEMGPAGVKDHLLWGSILGYILFYGPDKVSLDRWLCWKFNPQGWNTARA